MSNLEGAISLAVRAHEGQKDQTGQPYILHPLRVMLSLQEFGEEVQMVAVMHDLLEDTDVTAQMLRTKNFPEEVVEAVEVMTHHDNEPYIGYIARVKENHLARKVKVADIFDNLLPQRLGALDLPTQDRLKNKYTTALQFLTSNDESP